MKRKHFIYVIYIAAILSGIIFFPSCRNDDSPQPDTDNTPNLRALSAQEEEIIHSSNAFSFGLLSKVNAGNPDKNLFISPFSISSALSMTLNGANGETLTAMKATLQLEEKDEEEINEAYKELVSFLLSLDRMVTLEVANSNWYRNDLTIKKTFETTLLDFYDAEVKATDFEDPATLDQINGWIENKTQGKIQNMLENIPSDAVMYLINAIYFKADWKYQFDKKKTTDLTFHLSDGSSVKVPTMFSEDVKITYAANESVELIDIPYGNGQYTFTIVLPKDPTGINELIENLSHEEFSGLLSDTTTRTVELYLPKFKIAYKKLLNDVLIDMGMEIAFSNKADFSNLFNENADLTISQVMHQSFLEVNEEGSEAAAATSVEISLTSVGPAPVRIDRPFLFFIREKHSNTILFSGKLMDPS